MNGETDPTKHHVLHTRRGWLRTERTTRLRNMGLWVVKDLIRSEHTQLHINTEPLYVPPRKVLKDFEEMSIAVKDVPVQLDAQQLVVSDLLHESAISSSDEYAVNAFWLAHGIHEQIAFLRQINFGE